MSTPTPARPWARWYGTKRWRTVAEHQRHEHPLCAICLEHGVVTIARVTDHIVPHHGNPELFWSPTNLQSLCKHHHDSSKQQVERKGYVDDIGVDGWAVDPNHPSNRKRPWADD
jgi:5-methylcytosine-specific restriction protein A